MQDDEIVKQVLQINSKYQRLGLMGPFYTKDTILNAIRDNTIYTTEEDGLLVGFMLYNFMKRFNRINIKKLAVREEYHRRGYATEMLNKLIKVAEASNMDIQARVSSINTGTHQWYINRGFSIDNTGEKKSTSLFVYKKL